MHKGYFFLFFLCIGSISSFGQSDTIRKSSDTIIIKKAPLVIEKKFYESAKPISFKDYYLEASASYLLKDLGTDKYSYSDVSILSLSFGKKLSDWSISAGLSYSRANQKFQNKHIITYQEEKIITLKDTFDIWYTINKDGDTLTHYTIVEKDTVIQVWKNRDSTSDHRIKISFFSVPIAFHYNFQINKWQVRPGITFYPTIKRSYINTGENTHVEERAFELPATIQLGLSREVLKGLYPEARLGVMSNFLIPESGSYYFWLNAGIALRYEFN